MAAIQLFSQFPCKARVWTSSNSKSLSKSPILVSMSSIIHRPVFSTGGSAVSRADFRVRATDAEDEWGPEAGERGSALSVAEEAIEAVEETERLKRSLADSLYGTDRGLNASSETRAEIGDLITQLESKNPTPAPTEALFLLNGKWILA